MNVVLSRRACVRLRCIWYMLLFLVRTFSKHGKREGGGGDGGREKERERERERVGRKRDIEIC